MSHTIKVSGISDDLLSHVEARWRAQHFADRSEYVRDLLRRDLLSAPSLGAEIRSIFGRLHDELTRTGATDEEIAEEIKSMVAESRRAYRS